MHFLVNCSLIFYGVGWGWIETLHGFNSILTWFPVQLLRNQSAKLHGSTFRTL